MSTDMLIPSSPNAYDRRFEATAALAPVAVYGPAAIYLGIALNSPT